MLKLTSILRFGKYKNLTVEEAINTDWRYIDWCISNIKWFKIDEYCYKLLTVNMEECYESNRDFYSYLYDEPF